MVRSIGIFIEKIKTVKDLHAKSKGNCVRVSLQKSQEKDDLKKKFFHLFI